MDVVDKIVTVPTPTRGPHQNVPQVHVVIRKAREVNAPPPAAVPAAVPSHDPR
jgi:hypothetical protein